MGERKKRGFYLHDDETADIKSDEIINSISQRIRGDFLRNAVIAGCALHTIDPRLPMLIASFFDGKMTADQLVSMLKQTTGWQPDEASIKKVIAAIGGVIPARQPVAPETRTGEGDVRANMNTMFGE